MTTATVDFGCATFTNTRETERISCSLVASLQGELEAIDNGTISARILHQQKQWTRCRTPFPFRVSFSFDCLFQFAPEDKALIKQAVADKILSKSLWTRLGLVPSSCHYANDICTTSGSWLLELVVWLELSPNAVPIKDSKRWRRLSSTCVNDLHPPAEVNLCCLDAISIHCHFQGLLRDDEEIAIQNGEPKIRDSCVVLFEHCMRTVLCMTTKMSTSIRQQRPIDLTLEEAFPSIFCPAYTQAISQKSLLVPSVSRSLAAFRRRSGAAATTAGCITDLDNGSQQAQPVYYGQRSTDDDVGGIEVQLWRSMIEKSKVSARLSKCQTTPRGKVNTNHTSLDAVGTSHTLMFDDDNAQACGKMIGPEDIDMAEFVFKHGADQARQLSPELLKEYPYSGNAHNRISDAVHLNQMSFAEPSQAHVLLSCEQSDWTQYPDTDLASSQETVRGFEMHDLNKELWAFEERNQSSRMAWDDVIGQCEELTQISGREDPPAEPMLTRTLDCDCDEVYLEALHISTVSCQKNLCDSFQAVTDLDRIPCEARDLDSTQEALVSFDEPIGTARFPSSEFEFADSASAAVDEDIVDLFGQESYNMQTNDADMHDWHSRLSSPDLFEGATSQQASANVKRGSIRPGSESSGWSLVSGSFVKRSSIVSTSSSTDQRLPKRHRSILQRLSRSSSTKSRQDESDMSDLEEQAYRGREVDIKRRKTLDDYKSNDDREDDEMLFV